MVLTIKSDEGSVDGSWNLAFDEDATDKKSNVEVMTAAGVQRELMKTIRQRQLNLDMLSWDGMVSKIWQ